MKLLELAPVPLPLATVIGPVAPPAGMVTLIVVAVAELTVPGAPLPVPLKKVTLLFDATGSKSVPVSVIAVPAVPLG